MEFTEKKLVSVLTLVTSLAGYFYAKHFDRDPVPIVMLTGFFGAMIGESISKAINEKNNNDKNPPTAA